MLAKPTTAPRQWEKAPEPSKLEQKAKTVQAELTNLLTKDNIKNKETLELFNTIFKRLTRALKRINEEMINKWIKWLAFNLMKCGDNALWREIKELKRREVVLIWYMTKLKKIAEVCARTWQVNQEPFLETLADKDLNVFWPLFRIHMNSLFDFNRE